MFYSGVLTLISIFLIKKSRNHHKSFWLSVSGEWPLSWNQACRSHWLFLQTVSAGPVRSAPSRMLFNCLQPDTQVGASPAAQLGIVDIFWNFLDALCWRS